jgi:2-polyprenyl-6-hydroxyphenyl methylase/3-demethylubiquinone-9 3-methyltransferase
MTVAKNTVCLWYDNDAEEAARFYATTFADSAVGAIHRAPGDYPAGKAGDVLAVEFTVLGLPCMGLNGGPGVEHSHAFSFQVSTADQAETDRYWNAIVGHGGQEVECGWCRDKWGISWQITPVALAQAWTHPDRAAAKRAFDAMMTMKKIDVAPHRGGASRLTAGGRATASGVTPALKWRAPSLSYAASAVIVSLSLSTTTAVSK